MGIIVHIGLMKSGTTYIQNTLRRNKDALLKNGILYPGEKVNQQHACYGICESDIPWVKKNPQWRALGDQMLAETSAAQGDVLISSEALSCMSSEGVKRFVQKLGSIDKVLITIRSFQRVVLSAWQQYVKSGGLKDLVEFIAMLESDRQNSSGLWSRYGFRQIADIWSEYAPVTLIVVSPLIPKQGVLKAFCEELSIAELKPTTLSGEEENTSLDFYDVEILRFFNSENKNLGVVRQSYVSWLLKTAMFPAAQREPPLRIKMPERYTHQICDWARIEAAALSPDIKIIGDLSEIYLPQENYTGDIPEYSFSDLVMRCNLLFQAAFHSTRNKGN